MGGTLLRSIVDSTDRSRTQGTLSKQSSSPATLTPALGIDPEKEVDVAIVGAKWARPDAWLFLVGGAG
jgi:hypothetical protein